jgi:uncharacterized membrane protein
VSRAERAARGALSLGNRIAPPRFVVFLILLPVGAFGWRALTGGRGWRDAAAMGFDFAAVLFIASLWPLFRDCSAAAMREHSRRNEANRLLVLIITTLVSLAVMAAISAELAPAKAGDPVAMAKLIGTLLVTWLFANLVYALHYAHYYYATDPSKGGDVGGLDFPGTKVPDYRDFAYFALTLGMTFQTSDVAIRAAPLRQVALLHSFMAFVFNLGVIAFTINALGGG